MQTCSWLILLVLIVNSVFDSDIYGRCNVLVKRFEHCDPNIEYDNMYNLTFRTVGNKQFLDGTITIKKPYDNTLRLNATVEKRIGKNYVYLFSINEKRLCDTTHKLMGEFIYEVERTAQIIPGICPIPKGRYRFHNMLLNFEKITTLAIVPFGNLRFIDVVYRPNNSTYTCIIVDVENFGF